MFGLAVVLCYTFAIFSYYSICFRSVFRDYCSDHYWSIRAHVKAACVFFFFFSVLQGVLESFVGTALTGAVFCMLAGQPLTILSSTGPVLVFERLLFNFSK